MSEVWCAFQNWVSANSNFVSAISAAVAAMAAIVVGEYIYFPINLSDDEVYLIEAGQAKLWFGVSAAFLDYKDQEHIARGCWRWDIVAGLDDYGAVREPSLSRWHPP